MENKQTQEKIIRRPSGYGMLLVILLAIILAVGAVVVGIKIEEGELNWGIHPGWFFGISGVLFIIISTLSGGFMIIEPNKAAVLVLFGTYVGTLKKAGFYWVNPFYKKSKISLRLRNLNSEKLKVNDERGNPVEIGVVVVWQVSDTYAASFEVEDYDEFVTIQSESAVRHLAGQYPYDNGDEEGEVVSLRGSAEIVSATLTSELSERVSRAGVRIEEARISHLAYAPEIASAMLQRQQAEAIIAARKKIVDGAVGMVQMALEKLNEDGVMESFDEERRAAMVSNLMVVLCGDRSASPVINTGSIYN